MNYTMENSQEKDDYALLDEWLKDRGHASADVFKILERARKYEQETQLDLNMESIGAGRLNRAALIGESLAD